MLGAYMQIKAFQRDKCWKAVYQIGLNWSPDKQVEEDYTENFINKALYESFT